MQLYYSLLQGGKNIHIKITSNNWSSAAATLRCVLPVFAQNLTAAEPLPQTPRLESIYHLLWPKTCNKIRKQLIESSLEKSFWASNGFKWVAHVSCWDNCRSIREVEAIACKSPRCKKFTSHDCSIIENA